MMNEHDTLENSLNSLNSFQCYECGSKNTDRLFNLPINFLRDSCVKTVCKCRDCRQHFLVLWRYD